MSISRTRKSSLSCNKPCSLSKLDLLSSISGRSAFRTWFKHWDWRDDLVTVKLTKVTREQMSGGNSTVGSRVDKKMVNAGDKSISWKTWAILLGFYLTKSLKTIIHINGHDVWGNEWLGGETINNIQVDFTYELAFPQVIHSNITSE